MTDRMQRISLPIIFLSLAIVQSGCYVGTVTHVTADDLEYPVTLSNVMIESGHFVAIEAYQEIATFSSRHHWIGWAWPLQIPRDKDISGILNRVIEEHDGDAVVDLKIHVTDSPANALSLLAKTAAVVGGIVGGVMMFHPDGHAGQGALLFTGSSAVFIMAPGFTWVKIEGTVVNVD